MDEISLVIFGLCLLGLLIAVFVLGSGQASLRTRLRALEEEVDRLRDPGRAAPSAADRPAPWMAAPSAGTPDAPAPARRVGPSPDQPLPDQASAEPPTPAPPAGPGPGDRLAAWLKENWVYAVSAASLALAGIFLVQYGAERGLLPPGLRILSAIGLGLGLIGAGEVIRRRHGDGIAATTAFLPSVFSGAGLVSVFGAVVAARQMYGLIGPGTTFAGLLATALGAIALGWRYGPLLAATGLVGATVAPFLTAGSGAAPDWLQGYMLLLAAIGLVVDTLRRWAWVSILALVLGYGGGFLVDQAGASRPAFLWLLAALPLLAMAIPARSLIPDQAGPGVLPAVLARGAGGWPGFPVRLAAGAVAGSAVLLAGQGTADAGTALLALGLLAGLAVVIALWTGAAAGLQDLALIPALAFVLRVAAEAALAGPLAQEFRAGALRAQETDPPATVTTLVALAAAMSAAFALRALRGAAQPLAIGLGAALAAPVTLAVIELLWAPAAVIGAFPWALHAMAVAAGMVALATALARADGADRRRAAHAALAALSLIALALFVLTTKTALTLALAALAVVAAALDRRFRLPEMGLFLQVAVAVLGWRLLAEPGLPWAMEAALPQVLLAFGGAVAGLAVALWLILPLARPVTRAVLESAALGFAALLAQVLIARALTAGERPDILTHWGLALNALPWLILMLMQLWRAGAGGPLARVRRGVAALAGLLAAGGLVAAATLANPVTLGMPVSGHLIGLVRGPVLLDSLLVAYGLPGLMLLGAAWKMPRLSARLRLALWLAGAGLAVLWLGLEIRRLWQGPDLSRPGVEQGELYSYTLALLLLGAALLWQAIARGSPGLRRVAMGVIGLTVAKVFLIDAAGLSGLVRVFSFLALGLSLAGLALLNRWAARQAQGSSPPP